MAPNDNPAPKEGRASRVSFGDWTLDAVTVSSYRAQYLTAKFGVRPEVAAMLGLAAFGENGHG